MNKLLAPLLTAIVLPFLSGCLIPFTSERSSETTGRVVDDASHAPIAGVNVRWSEQTNPCVKTGTLGTFTLPRTLESHLLLWGHSSLGAYHNDRQLLLTHPHYQNTIVNALAYRTNSITGRGQRAELKDILLTRKLLWGSDVSTTPSRILTNVPAVPIQETVE